MNKKEKKPKIRKMSTSLFIASGIAAFAFVLNLVIGIWVLATGSLTGVSSIIIALLCVYVAIICLRRGIIVLGLSEDEYLISAAIFDHLIKSGKMSEMENSASASDSSEEASASGSLEELRQARKAKNASD